MKLLFRILIYFLFWTSVTFSLNCNSEERISANNRDYAKKEIEKLIKKQKEIDFLSIRNYRDTVFPNDFILRFENLNEILIWGAGWYQQPLHIDTTKLSRLKKLKTLQIIEFGLDSFPTSLYQNDSLTSLVLGWCNLKSIPSGISKFNSLVFLDLWGNDLTALPESLKDIPNLQTLRLNNNLFERIPKVLKDLANVKTIILNNREGDESSGLNENKIDYKSETFLLTDILKKESVKVVAIEIKDCESKKTIKKSIGDKQLLKKIEFPFGVCNPLFW
ncbi:MAG: hypothetical protein ABI723_03230 [Bacteroidia bacterium]